MSFFFNKKARTTCAVVISSLSLAGMAWATYQSGEDVGTYCASKSTYTLAMFDGCCKGGCASMHTDPSAGFSSCMSKCLSHFVAETA